MIECQDMLLLGFGYWEILICAAVFMLLFGGAKLPGLMRNLGRSVNEFKAGIKEQPTDANIEDSSNSPASERKSERDAETPVS